MPALDLVLAGGLVAWAVVSESTATDWPHPWSTAVGAVWAASLLLRTRAPLVMAAVAAAATIAYALLPVPTTLLWAFPTLLLMAFSVGANLAGRRRLLAGGLLLVSVYVMMVLTSTRPGGDTDFSDVYLSPLVLVAAPMLAGMLLRHSRHQTAELQRLSAALDAEREISAQAAVAEERTRIARELHDVISHSVSVIVVQAGAAQSRLRDDSPVHEQLAAIRRTGKETLTELRRLLGVLRDGPEDSPSPMPALADVVGLATDSGADLEYDAGQVGDVPAGLALAVYRVVQEALTNARKHAAGSAVRVRLQRDDATLGVEVVNGPGCPWPEASAVDGGHGLAGMAERVGLYGGRLETGRCGDGGWRVHALFPIPLDGPTS